MHTMRVDDTYRLSPMQEAMLFQYRLDPRTGVYIQQTIGLLNEDLDVLSFQKAWEQVVSRHTVLRTSFRWEGLDEPLQDVHSGVDLSIEMHDWRGISLEDQSSRFEEFLKHDRQRGIDLTQAPLFRLTLIRLGNSIYKFLWTHHHMILDGQSKYIILREVNAFYEAGQKGEIPHLFESMPYRDHIDRIYQIDWSRSEAFWRKLLSGFSAPTPIDLVSKAVSLENSRDGRGEREARISRLITSTLSAIASQNHFTLNTIVQGAWSLLLSRYTGEPDIVFGSVIAGRRSLEADRMADAVGLFINTLPVRVRVSMDQNLIQWLGELREQQITVRKYEQTPLVRILGWSDVPRGMPLFESDIVFDRRDLNEQLQAEHETWRNRKFSLVEESSFPLTLYGIGGNELALKISYDKRRFDDATIERMLGHLKTLLEGMALEPDIPLKSLPMLTSREKDQILVEWNNTQVDYPLEKCIHQQFEEQVARTPDAMAVSFDGQELTYQELNHRANQLAYYLQHLGVGPEVFVGVFMKRSLEMVIALYGILKAGGAYVPLDPEYPADRIMFMLNDTQVPVVLTQERLASQLPLHQSKVVCLDSEWPNISREGTDNPIHGANSENVAYVIYTSGSTGKPKGVMNYHRGVSNRLYWMQDAFQLNETDRVLQKTPFSFDVSVWEFFWPLLVGAGLVVAQPDGHKDSAYLIRLIVEQNITTIHFVPSMLQIFLEDHDVTQCKSLKRVICSGEALPYDLQTRFFARLNTGLFNLYGPTEAAVDVTYWECRGDSGLKIVPIGRPIANTQLYILDSSLQPVPIGVSGELYIGGVQVAKGYLNRPELTAERFIQDPFSKNPKARLYKTGDLTRFLPDGIIEYQGRLDFQVKIRGFRIELGEIEEALSQHPSIREVVVLAREDTAGDKRLVAYVVPEPPSQVNVGELREMLKRQLPEYMVPAAFVVMKSLPLNSNGKVDRRSLPAPEMERHSEKVFIPPQKELEKVIAGIWRELLQVERVGIDDNFFDLGGHSLLIMRAHSRLCDASGLNLSITDMFKYPTIRTLSHYLAQDSEIDSQVPSQKSADQAKGRRDVLLRQREIRQKKGGEVTNE